jgi:cell division protease FtsH
MLHGKPGTGKTFIANAFANEMDAKFIKVSLGEIGSKYQNATSKNITNLFKDARKEEGNVILLLDEVDSLASKRGSESSDKEKNNTLNTLLQEMSSDDNDNIFIICATNFYELLDPAFCRVGRIDVTLEIPLPNFETRLQILELNTKRKPLGEDVDLAFVSEQMEGKNCADVAFVCNQAARIALKKDKMEINQEDFVEALERMNVKKEVEKVKKIGFELNK